MVSKDSFLKGVFYREELKGRICGWAGQRGGTGGDKQKEGY